MNSLLITLPVFAAIALLLGWLKDQRDFRRLESRWRAGGVGAQDGG